MPKRIAASILSLWVFVIWPAAAWGDGPAKREAKGDAKNDAAAELRRHKISLAQPLGEGKSIEERLEVKASFLSHGGSIENFAVELEKALGTPVKLLTNRIEDEQHKKPRGMFYDLKNVRVKSALKLILSELGLTYLVRENTLQLTTLDDAASQLETRVYDFRDLMKLPSAIKKPREIVREIPATGGGFGGGPRMHIFNPSIGRDGNYEIGDLFIVITTCAEPDSWDDVGGPGSISEFKGLAIIQQTQEVHERVELLLNQLHTAGGLEEKVKVYRLSKK